jgi:hypothetical protein
MRRAVSISHHRTHRAVNAADKKADEIRRLKSVMVREKGVIVEALWLRFASDCQQLGPPQRLNPTRFWQGSAAFACLLGEVQAEGFGRISTFCRQAAAAAAGAAPPDGVARGEGGSAAPPDGVARGEGGSAAPPDGVARGEGGEAAPPDGVARGEGGEAAPPDGVARGEGGEEGPPCLLTAAMAAQLVATQQQFDQVESAVR